MMLFAESFAVAFVACVAAVATHDVIVKWLRRRP